MTGPRHFCTTRWTVVRHAGDPSSPQRREALAELLQTYWYPLYGFIRRQGYDSNQAEDVLQGFIAGLLERDSLQNVRAGEGRFRNFLLVCLRNFMASEASRAAAQKRGGGARVLSLDFDDAMTRYHLQPAHEATAEKLFERDWALELIQQTVSRLADEWRQQGKESHFAQLSPYLVGAEERASYAATASALGMTEGAVKTAVHRLRARFRQLLCEQVSATLANDELLADEIRRMFAALNV
jgi:RNA polymerase sigma-70 factor (ECF subfamily)